MSVRMLAGGLVVALVGLMAATVEAQPPPRGRGGPGGFFGGPGGGDPALLLLRSEEVRKELEIVDDQKAALEKLAEEARGRQGGRPDVNFRELSEEERAKRFEEMRKEAEARSKEMRAKVDEILLPHQAERLKQLSIQFRRGGALMDPEVAAALKLSDEQKQKLETVQGEQRDKLRSQAQELFQGGNRDAIREKMAEWQKEQDAALLAVLTDDQKKEFEAMKGEAFEFPRMDFGFGGGGRPGGGNRPQRPDNN